MEKVNLLPRTGSSERSTSEKEMICRFVLEGQTVIFDCRKCSLVKDAPEERCLEGLRAALAAHPEAVDLLLQGEQDIWLRDRGLDSLRSLIAAEMAWENFRSAICSLPCFKPISMDRTSRYVEKVRAGGTDLFCKGEGRRCSECLERQREALGSLRSDRNRARRTVAMDRFRITEVMGGGSE